MAAFLAANPALANTTHSRGSHGGMVWVRIEFEFTKSCKSERFEWRAWQSLDDLPGGSCHDHTEVLTWRPLNGLAFSDS